MANRHARRDRAERGSNAIKIELPSVGSSFNAGPQLPLNGRRVLVVDDDPRLLRNIAQWLAVFGASVGEASNITAVRNQLIRLRPSHALLDYRLGENESFAQIADLLKEERIVVAVFTGATDSDKARQQAMSRKFGLISKPANLAEIISWLDDPKASPPIAIKGKDNRRWTRSWSVEVRTEMLIGEAGLLLDQMCARHNLRGGLWIVELSEGVYELRARSETLKNIDLSHLLTRLGQSVVRDTLSHAHEGDLSTRQGPLPLNDPLFVVAQRLDLKNPHIVTVPIQIYGLSPRLILFLREGSESDDRIDRIEARRGHFELLSAPWFKPSRLKTPKPLPPKGGLRRQSSTKHVMPFRHLRPT